MSDMAKIVDMTHTHAGSNPATALTDISVVTDNNS